MGEGIKRLLTAGSFGVAFSSVLLVDTRLTVHFSWFSRCESSFIQNAMCH